MTTERQSREGAAAGKQRKDLNGKAGAGPAVTSRELALDILLEILERGALSHVVLRQALGKYQYLDKQDRALTARIVEGTLEYRIQIDYVIGRFSRTKPEKLKPLIRTLLEMSVYQILYMDRIPDSAVCNEAVKLAAKRRFEGLKGFVNGVLRSIAREKDRYRPSAENGGSDPWPDDSVRYSMPRWLIDLWTEACGEERARGMMKAFLKESPFVIRCNLDRAPKNEIMESIRRQGAKVTEHGWADDMLILNNVDYPERLSAFQKGFAAAQDLSSACAAKAAGIRAGDIVLDVCGAPGGKAIHAASLLRRAEGAAAASEPDGSRSAVAAQDAGKIQTPRGHVFVRDISDRKVSMIRESIARCGYEDTVTAQVWDARIPDEGMTERADVVLADLPCSGLGVIGRKPDIKSRIRPEEIAQLAALQREILSVVWRYVKPGGILVYSTCTVSPQENIRNRDWFLSRFPFEPADITGRLGGKFDEESLKDGYIQLLPGTHPCDGFFLAVMRRLETRESGRSGPDKGYDVWTE